MSLSKFLIFIVNISDPPASHPNNHVLTHVCSREIRRQIPVPYEKYEQTTRMRGLRLILGWQTDRIAALAPLHASLGLFGITVIWLCLILWKGGGGDWGTSFAFAQVVAASVAIGITYVQQS